LVVLVLAIGVVWSMPDAAIKRLLTPGLQPVATAPGTDGPRTTGTEILYDEILTGTR
jgi:hypothetical protein